MNDALAGATALFDKSLSTAGSGVGTAWRGWPPWLHLGASAPVYRTNYLFRGMIVPAGEHTIRMVYRPGAAWLGLAISALTVLGMGLGFARLRPIRLENQL